MLLARLGGAVLVCAGCFAGSSIVGNLRFAGNGPAIIYPPYAVLTVALLLTPVRTWWLYLLASSVGSVGPHLSISPSPHVFGAELANYIKAIVGAAGARWIIGGAPRDLGSKRAMAGLLLFAGGVGPVSGALVGATSATTLGGASDFLAVCRGWTLSNALTGVTLLPVILLGIQCVRRGPCDPSPRRVAEAVVLFTALFAVGFIVFDASVAGAELVPSRLCWPLPFLLWASVRFGPGGASLALCLTTNLAVWGALGGRGPFVADPSPYDIVELQVFLLAVALPLMLLAALVAEQRDTAAALRASEREARRRLALLGTIYRTAPVGLAFVDAKLRYVDVSEDLAQQNGVSVDAHLGRTLRDVLPASFVDAVERNYRWVLNTGTPLGDVELHEPASDRHWVVDYHPVRDDAGEVFGVNTVVQEDTARRRAEAVLRRSERLNVAILQSLRDHVAVLNREGDIIAVNEAWLRFGRIGRAGAHLDRVDDAAKGGPAPGVGVGLNYLHVCRRAPGAARADVAASAADALAGITAVLERSTHSFEMDYLCPTPARDRWFHMMVTPLEDPDGGAVVSHRDVTDLKHAEQVVRRSEASLRASNQRAQDLAGRLISAQEAERSRIARELHDDVNQQLAAISLSISALRRAVPEGADPMVQEELAAIQRMAIDAADDVRLLSHQLHPGVLRHAGLPAALKSYCGEFRERHGIAVSFEAGEGVEAMMASAGPDAALCLYRAAQEALVNVARHAGARHATVSLSRTDAGTGAAGIELVVKDDGRGFDVDAAREAGGLGLRSMDERARLVRGTAAIESRPHAGTVIRLNIPVVGGPADVSANRVVSG